MFFFINKILSLHFKKKVVMKYQQKNYLFLVFALFMGCMVLFNSCNDDDDDTLDCTFLDCGLGNCIVDNGLAVCECPRDSISGELIYDGENCENCIAINGECPPNSHCVIDGCDCDEGYDYNSDTTACISIDSLDTVIIDSRDVYIGAYSQTDTECSDTSIDPSTLENYATVDITASSTENNVLFFNNLSALNDIVRVELSDDDLTRFEIPEQTTPDGHVFESLTIGTFNVFESGDTLLSIQYRLIPFGGSQDVVHSH